MPEVSSSDKAASAVLSAAKACVNTAGLINKNDAVSKADVVHDWARVATDVAGIFFPPIGTVGALGSSAYTGVKVYEAVSDYRSEHPSDDATATPA